MVKHIVMFKFKGSQEEKEKICQNFAEALIQLPDDIPQLISMETGVNINSNEQWDFVLIATASSLNDISVYSSHPAHLAAVSIIAPYKIDRACVDYYV